MPRTFSEVYTCTFCPRVQTVEAWMFRFIPVSGYIYSSLQTVYEQSATATLSGIVCDKAGAVIPGVNVAAISISQAFQRSATTNDEETFVIIPCLPPGSYTIKAERGGCKPAEPRIVVLNANAYIKLEISLDGSPSVSSEVDSNFEHQIAKVEQVSVRVFGLIMLLLALLAPLIYGGFELVKFISRLHASV